LSVAGTPVSSTLVMDTTPKPNWDITFGRFNQISGWGMVAGRVVGLLWISYAVAMVGNGPAQRGLWILGGTLSIASVVWAWYTVPEPRMPKPRPVREPVPELTHHSGYALIERVRFLPASLYYLPKWNMVAGTKRLLARMRARLRHLPDHMHLTSEQGARLIHEPLMLYYYASFFLFLVGTAAYTPFAVWQVDELNNSTTAVFLVGLMNSVAAAFSYRWIGQVIRYVGSLRVQMATVSLRIAVFGGFGLMSVLGLQGAPSVVLLIVLQAISGLGWAGIAVAGNSTVAHLASKGNEGIAMGTYTSFISVGAIIGAFISGYMVLWFGYAAVFFLSALGVALTVAMLWWIRRTAGHRLDAQL
jgi:MFS family permease